ncbi:Uncharacterized protein QTN25_002786 [Entamoeba marina]
MINNKHTRVYINLLDEYKSKSVQSFTTLHSDMYKIKAQLLKDKNVLMEYTKENQTKEYQPETIQFMESFDNEINKAENEIKTNLERHQNEMKKMSETFNKKTVEMMHDSQNKQSEMLRSLTAISKTNNDKLRHAIAITHNLQTKLASLMESDN